MQPPSAPASASERSSVLHPPIESAAGASLLTPNRRVQRTRQNAVCYFARNLAVWR